MLVVGYYGLLRVGEITKGPHSIKAKDVHIGLNKEKFLFILRTSKTHDEGSCPQMVKVSHRIDKKKKPTKVIKHNPFSILHDYVNLRPLAVNDAEQFFVFSDNAAVKPDQLRKILRLLIRNIGLQPELYNIHSLRIGRWGDLLKLGLSIETIKKIGHWKSNAVFAYLRNI